MKTKSHTLLKLSIEISGKTYEVELPAIETTPLPKTSLTDDIATIRSNPLEHIVEFGSTYKGRLFRDVPEATRHEIYKWMCATPARGESDAALKFRAAYEATYPINQNQFKYNDMQRLK